MDGKIEVVTSMACATAVVIGIMGVFAGGVGFSRRLHGGGGSKREGIGLLLFIRSISDIVRLSDMGNLFSDKVALFGQSRDLRAGQILVAAAGRLASGRAGLESS